MPKSGQRRVDAAERVEHALVEEVAPGADDHAARRRACSATSPCAPSGWQTCGRASSWTMKRPTRVPASSMVRMKSASNMIAKWYQMPSRRSPPMRAAEDVRHADGERGRAAGAVEQRLLADAAAASASIVAGSSGKPQPEIVAAACSAVAPDDPGRAVDREVDAGLERAGRDHRHHADERLHQHRAVADEPRVALAHQQLRRRAGGDQRVEAARSAPQAIVMKQNGKTLPAKTGPVPSTKRVSAGIWMVGRTSRMPGGEREHDADLDEGRQVVARREQQPHRQRRGGEAVDDDGERERRAGEREDAAPTPASAATHWPADDRDQHEHEADRRGLQHAPGPPGSACRRPSAARSGSSSRA